MNLDFEFYMHGIIIIILHKIKFFDIIFMYNISYQFQWLNVLDVITIGSPLHEAPAMAKFRGGQM